MIDTHCHLEMDAFDGDREEIIKKARDAGLEFIITVGSDLQGCKETVALARQYDFIYAAVGIHPHNSKDFREDVFTRIKEWSKDDKVVAIGEVGLDYHYDHSPRDVQRNVFIRQIEYAKETDLPLVVHSRESKWDTLKILEETNITKGVMHCFSGDIEMAEKAMAMGLYISIAGPVTFKNTSRLREIVKFIPDDYLLIETDAPYLAPEPLRGKRNEPAFVVHTAKFLAGLRGVSIGDIERITSVNAKRLFGIGELLEGEIAYEIRDNLYLNMTNRCTNKCVFCVRFHVDFLKGHNLRLKDEPTEGELRDAIGDPSRYKEVVFCGYGEPLLRLDVVKSLASWIKKKGVRVRINTNGHGNIIHKRNILHELRGIVDSISISLNAHDEETYQRICRPAFKDAFKEVLNFVVQAKRYIPEVRATVVTMKEVDISKCKKITDGLDVRLRVRRLDVVG
ncbi:YchF/TatD family DNA exonuclease [Thermodesulfovibrionales bacterium]|nr:YchF/TatD family DNA exonuclease [Thermodesulfovibrionales bacterium]